MATFERKFKENLELRMKWADAPEKFLDSEVDLDEQIKSLMQASAPGAGAGAGAGGAGGAARLELVAQAASRRLPACAGCRWAGSRRRHGRPQPPGPADPRPRACAAPQVASVPELYPDLLELNVVPTLVTLLQHENSDILGDVIELLSELTGAGVRATELAATRPGPARLAHPAPCHASSACRRLRGAVPVVPLRCCCQPLARPRAARAAARAPRRRH